MSESATVTRGRPSYPMEIATPSPKARKRAGGGAGKRYVGLFENAIKLLEGHPLGTTVRITEFSTTYGAANTKKDILKGETVIADPPEGLIWNVEGYIEDKTLEDGTVVEVSRLYANLAVDGPEDEPVADEPVENAS